MTRAIWLGLVAALVFSGSPVSAAGSIGTVIEGGNIGWAQASHGPAYLAIRAPRGTHVRICGPAQCLVLRSTDYGPSSKIDPPRIADLAVGLWEKLCGMDRSRGLCPGSVEYPVDVPALPPTDSAPAPAYPWFVVVLAALLSFGAVMRRTR